MPQSPHRLQNDAKCIEWDAKPCYITRGRWKCGTGKCRIGKRGTKDAGVAKCKTWKMPDLKCANRLPNKFHIHAHVRDTSSRPHCMWVSGADYTKSNLAKVVITRAQTVRCSVIIHMQKFQKWTLTEIFFHTTFKVVHGIFYQLLTIFTSQLNSTFPVMNVLMTCKSKDLYQAEL